MVNGYQDYMRRQELVDQKTMVGGRGVYYWITTISDGKTVIIGYKDSYLEADQYARTVTQGNPYKITPLRTRDVSSAARFLKGQLLKEYSDLSVATKRMVRSQYTKQKRQRKLYEKNKIHDMFEGMEEEY